MPEFWDYKIGAIDYLNKIDSTNNPQEKQQIAEEFVNKLIADFTKNVDFIIDRFREIKSDVEVLGVPRNLMDALKESIFCYVNGQYLSTIASIGIASELFCVHLYRIFLEDLGLEDFKIRRRIDKFSRISQSEKIDTLFSIVDLSEDICSILHEIREIRNANTHPHPIKDYKDDALQCLQCMIHILNRYSNDIKIQQTPLTIMKVIPVQREDDLIIGEKMAKLNMFWYLDYQCPFCKKFWMETLPIIKKNYVDTNKMNIIIRHFPLVSIHPLAQLSAEFVRCMNNVSLTEKNNLKLHNKIFENQDKISHENLQMWVNELGCNVDFCIQSGQSKEYIASSIIESQNVGARGTPHFVIGNSHLSGAYPYEIFRNIIEEELKNV